MRGNRANFARRLMPALLLSLLLAGPLRAAVSLPGKTDVSFRNEVQRALDKGLDFLRQNQDTNGWWSTPDHPAVTALALTAFMGEPNGRWKKPEPAFMHKGYAFILACAQPDGSICKKELQNYNTAVAMVALLAANKPEYEPVLRQARGFLIGSQVDLDENGKLDNALDGGVGYGSTYKHSDMINTLTALEALYYSRYLISDKDPGDGRDLNWAAAIHFIQNCQNLPGSNPQDWASAAPQHKGGFIYYPGQSMAGTETNAATGRVAFRSYGSASYAGLLSYIYASLKREDPRVTAAFEWLRLHYTLEENPGMGPQGLYYYLHLMTKALTLYGVDELELKDGRKLNWRKETALRLINLQKSDGSWANDNGRWWEKDPSLVTAYSVLALEMIYRGL